VVRNRESNGRSRQREIWNERTPLPAGDRGGREGRGGARSEGRKVSSRTVRGAGRGELRGARVRRRRRGGARQRRGTMCARVLFGWIRARGVSTLRCKVKARLRCKWYSHGTGVKKHHVRVRRDALPGRGEVREARVRRRRRRRRRGGGHGRPGALCAQGCCLAEYGRGCREWGVTTHVFR
jgi:hypothetical protein